MQFSRTVSRRKALASLNMDYFSLSLKFISLQHCYVLRNLLQHVCLQLAHQKGFVSIEKASRIKLSLAICFFKALLLPCISVKE